MLEDAIAMPSAEARKRLCYGTGNDQLVVHTDRVGHDRGAEWVETMHSAGLTRSMSRKGKSGDNAACEGVFGRMKKEMFRGRIWEKAAEVEGAIAEYREASEAKPSKKQSQTPFVPIGRESGAPQSRAGHIAVSLRGEKVIVHKYHAVR